jgi:hypothetical protein
VTAFHSPLELGLKQGTIRMQPPEFSQPATFSGPLLKEVLAAVDADRAKVSFVAVEGYTGWRTRRTSRQGIRSWRLPPTTYRLGWGNGARCGC